LAMWWLWQIHRQRLRLFLDMDDWEGAGGWNDLAPYTTFQKRFFAWQEQWGIGHAHGITVASRALQSIVWGRGVAADRVDYLPNGSGLAMAGLPMPDDQIQDQRAELNVQDRPALLVYSRFFEFDAARLVAILSGVSSMVEDLAIIFIGESLYAADAISLRQELEKHDLLPGVVNLGWVDVADLPLLLRSCDAALYLMDDTLINRTKCPVKLADLAGAGVPVVAEEVGQVSAYVVNGVTGYTRPSGDIDGLVRDAAALLQNAAKRADFGQAAQDLYNRDFSWARLAAGLDTFYRR
jgi:glycosyltransferase involved in cell wall biosynthesis